jgi:hypothetical protein
VRPTEEAIEDFLSYPVVIVYHTYISIYVVNKTKIYIMKRNKGNCTFFLKAFQGNHTGS